MVEKYVDMGNGVIFDTEAKSFTFPNATVEMWFNFDFAVRSELSADAWRSLVGTHKDEKRAGVSAKKQDSFVLYAAECDLRSAQCGIESFLKVACKLYNVSL